MPGPRGRGARVVKSNVAGLRAVFEEFGLDELRRHVSQIGVGFPGERCFKCSNASTASTWGRSMTDRRSHLCISAGAGRTGFGLRLMSPRAV